MTGTWIQNPYANSQKYIFTNFLTSFATSSAILAMILAAFFVKSSKSLATA